MDVTTALAAFSLAALLLTLTPGLDTALVLRTAAVEGGRQAMLAGSGISAGVLVWGLLAALGLGAVLAVSETAFLILQIAGAGYLAYLGSTLLWRAFARQGLVLDTAPARQRPGSWFARGLLTNLLNPKVGAFYVGFLPQFIPAGVDVVAFSALLTAIHGLFGLLWFAALVLATRPLAAFLRRPSTVRAIDATTGAVLIAFGIKLAFTHRPG